MRTHACASLPAGGQSHLVWANESGGQGLAVRPRCLQDKYLGMVIFEDKINKVPCRWI